MSSSETKYRYLDKFSLETGIPPENLTKVFQIELEFHHRIVSTTYPSQRKELYASLYNTVHPLLNQNGQQKSSFQSLVRTFRPELENRSVLDVGCGSGQFLCDVAESFPHGELVGLDVSSTDLPQVSSRGIQFVRGDIIDFSFDRQFDVVFSHQVFEHIAPADVSSHLRSIWSALVPRGTLILILPNRFWGPSDITRIMDNTYTGKIQAMGSHLNESSYSELVPLLRKFGFSGVHTVIPYSQKLPLIRHLRVPPYLNYLFERIGLLRHLSYLVRIRGRAAFKNPVVLVCEK